MLPAPSLSVRILLVEDSEDDLFFFQRALKQTGIETSLTHKPDGRAAISYLERVLAGEERMPDLMFLDLKMPAFTGFEVLEWLSQQKFQRALPVAVLSGSEQPGDVERALALGASAYFVKPIHVQQLRTRIAECTMHPGATGHVGSEPSGRKAAVS